MKLFLAFTLLLFGLFFSLPSGAQTLKSPEEFLGYQIGSRFTWHHQLVDYFEYVAQQNDHVLIKNYGKSYEGRPLLAAIISSQKNIDDLERIRINNLRMAGMEEGPGYPDDKVIVWLSYNVHGNEASSAETSMQTLYALADGKDPLVTKWLENTIVIIDPCLNPDGRERYVQWFTQTANHPANPNSNSREHHEPWPQGRSNHYLFDLNRDWTWITQQESKYRIKLYQEWLPHIHVDYHEQYIYRNYYFAPAASPIHPEITAWQGEAQKLIGNYNAGKFDEQGWLYFTGEVFDLLYPGYGDTYPMFNGAIGMTYEMPGHSKGGLSVVTARGDTLTLSDRIEKHLSTSLSTIEAASDNATKIVQEFSNFFSTGGQDQYYLIKNENNATIRKLSGLLNAHGIRFKYNSEHRYIKGQRLGQNEKKSLLVEKNDLIINLRQPKAKLIKVLFEPVKDLPDTVAFDITAWSLPYAYNLTILQTTEKLNGNPTSTASPESKTCNDPVAFVADWLTINDTKFVSALIKRGLNIRRSEVAVNHKGRQYKPGSVMITKEDNKHLSETWDSIITKTSKEHHKEVDCLQTGNALENIDLGSTLFHLIEKPKVALLTGPDIVAQSLGETWFFFEQEIEYPLDIIQMNTLNSTNLNDYNVLIFPSGEYEDMIQSDSLQKVTDWIEKGGVAIVMQDAIKSLSESKKLAVGVKEEKTQLPGQKPNFTPFSNRKRIGSKNKISGSILEITLDPTHPLAWGYDSYYYSLNFGGTPYKLFSKGWNVGFIGKQVKIKNGTVNAEVIPHLENRLIFGVEDKGSGHIVYMVDNPLFRSFWDHGKLLFSNAVFMGRK